MSDVDVVVPCYNYGRYLTDCVESILSQEGVHVRILIIDDASVDDTAEVGFRLALHDERIEFRRHQINQGHIATFNEGILDWVRAKYCLLLSADDALTPGALARAAALMDAHDDVGFVYGSVVAFDGNIPTSECLPSGGTRIVNSATFLEYCCGQGNPVPTPTAVVRTSVQHQVGGYLPKFPFTHDMELWMRIACCGPVGILEDRQAYYRWHAESITHRYSALLHAGRLEILRACEHVLRYQTEVFPDAGYWLRDLRIRMRDELLVIARFAHGRGDRSGHRECVRIARAADPSFVTRRTWWWILYWRHRLVRFVKSTARSALRSGISVGSSADPRSRVSAVDSTAALNGFANMQYPL